MGLYLCVRDESDEIDGVDVGSYADYGRFIEKVVEHAEGKIRGSKCPVLTLHHDSDGRWTPEECSRLQIELGSIFRVFSALPPISIKEAWQLQVAKTFGLKPQTLSDCFFDVDGEPLITRLVGLCQIAIERRHSILFQ